MAGISDTVKAMLRRAANGMGYDIVGFDGDNPRARLARLLNRHRINVVFDVGANCGAFGWDLRELGFAGKIVSFEPLQDAFAQLQDKARHDPKWQAVNIGLGARDEERVLQVAANSQSSSFLPMLNAHVEAAPESAYQGQQIARLRRLDQVFGDYCGPDDRIFLKIDTQGFEEQVLEGAGATLAAMPLVQLECSLVPLYEGGQTIESLIGLMRSRGYAPIDMLTTFRHRDSAHLMQVDVLFARH